MLSTTLKIAGVVAIGYIAFQVGRNWDEISEKAVEIADDAQDIGETIATGGPADAPSTDAPEAPTQG